jgi:hypothetical protein
MRFIFFLAGVIHCAPVSEKQKTARPSAGHAVCLISRSWWRLLPGRPDRSVRRPKVKRVQEVTIHDGLIILQTRPDVKHADFVRAEFACRLGGLRRLISNGMADRFCDDVDDWPFPKRRTPHHATAG